MLNKSLYPYIIYNDKTNCRKQFTSIREKLNDELHLHKQFDYYYNNFGFRSIHEEDYTLNDVNDIWCFGCSFTFGSGVSRQDCWPGIIQTKTNRAVKNFGIPGVGPLTVYRLINGWYNSVKNKPKKIFVMGFFPGRTEIWSETKNLFITQTAQDFRGIPYNPLEVESMYERIVPKIKNFTNTTIFLDVLDIEKSAKKNNRYDRGRDASEKLEKEKNLWGHPGPQFHEFVADTVIKKYL